MSDQLPAKGEKITIRWPGGPHDFVMEFREEDTHMSPPPGWHYLYGVIVSPENWHPKLWAPMAHLVVGEWAMLPMGGKLSDVEP